AGSNIYKKVYKDGNLRDTPAIWGGEDGIFGTGDDKKVIGFPDGSYWRHMGQNVWKKVDKNKLDPLTGGGPDGDPTTDPVMKIYDNTAQDGKYYVGPLGSGDDIYYYGDNPVNGNGKLDSTENSLENTDTKFYKDKDGNFTTTKPPLPIKDTPESVEGGTLSPSQTGDSAAWVEIARNGDYSLIVRTHFINIYNGYYNDPAWQYTSFGSSAEYSSSLVRKFINAWWKGTGAGVTDKLPTNARIRKFTVENNAIDRIGTGSSSTGGLTNGFSQPTDIFIPSGSLDVAFALSFTESANFASKSYSTNGSGAFNDSSAAASSNFEKIDLSAGYGYGLWLRSPGEIKDTVGAIAHTGSAFQFSFSSSSTNRGLIFPAMWVKTTIFEA
ncbi:MAG: hypothetical protein FWC09_05190, partial [Lachnospiraceae bacterium]|nr:hypothetical protein [Lachnospiraceae bacterium]